jgi:hypothetical protein
MKKLMRFALLPFVCTFVVACAGLKLPDGPDAPPKELSLQQVREINLFKGEIFDKTMELIAQSFGNSKEVIQLKDRENGKIIGKGLTHFMSGGITRVPVRFTLIVEIKDNKYRTTYSDFAAIGMVGGDPLVTKRFVDDVKVHLMEFDESLYDYLTKAKANSNW